MYDLNESFQLLTSNIMIFKLMVDVTEEHVVHVNVHNL